MKLIFVLVLIFGLGFCTPVFAQSSAYVTRQGSQLYLYNQPYRFVGVNRYNLLTTGGNPYRGCGGSWSESDLDPYFSELKQQGIQAIRFWMFQSFTDSGAYFNRMDTLINLSTKYGVLLMPVFENHWSACTTGGEKTADWYSTGYKSTYGYSKTLKEYISVVVSRYKNSPQILAWQIMNEAESSDGQSLVTFADDIARTIKMNDPNHLVSFGTLGSNQNGMNMYRQIHSSQAIDLLEYHDYDYDCCGVLYPPLLDTRIADAAALNKPIFVGEAGIRTGCTGCISLSERSQIFDNKIRDFFGKEGSGYLIWSYRDREFNQSTDAFGFNQSDPLSSVIKRYSQQQLTTPSPAAKPADANNDGYVNGSDYIVWLVHYNVQVTGKQNGDFNGDGRVNGSDYIVWLTTYGT